MTIPMTPERLFEIRVQRSTARACKTVEAGPVFEAVDELLAEVTRLRPMETALEAAEAEVQRLREWQMRVAEALGIYEPAGPGPEMCEQDPTRAAEYADMAADAVQERNDLVQEVEHKTAILEAIGKLHWPVEYAPDRPDICYTCCTDQAEDLEHGYKTCTVEKHKHTPGGPICPTRAALDGGA